MDGKMDEQMDNDDGKMGRRDGTGNEWEIGLLMFANDLFGSKKRRGEGMIFV
jgi:hypothetical protein